MNFVKITKLSAREILDSRGIPTIETTVTLSDGSTGKFGVPAGSSTGTSEAFELRDNDPTRYHGNGVLTAVNNVQKTIANEIVDRTFPTQEDLDDTLIDLDGTPNKSKLGGNTILSVSAAFFKAIATSKKLQPYQYFQKVTETPEFTLPQMQILLMEGGKHGNWATDFQEYMIVPRKEVFTTVAESIQAGSEIFWATREILNEKGYSVNVGFEGAYAPPEIRSNTEAFEIILAGIEKAGYTPGEEIVLAIDAAASEFYEDGVYNLKREGKQLTSDEWIALQIEWLDKYPIWSLEDTLDEKDWDGWTKLTTMVGGNLQVVGDDLLTTNVQLITKAAERQAVNAIIIKINQIGTLTEALDAINAANEAGFATIVSHRSGETNDNLIADMVMGTSSSQTKFGGADRGERLAKYNRLLEIESQVTYS